jgi:acyl-CoA synthetase (AMP-forming)/AMP-acid ligase II
VLAHPAVARAAAFGLPHAEKGQVPAAAVELRGTGLVSEDELVAWCRERLAAYKAPRRIWIVEKGELAQNTTGKMMRRVIQEHFATFEESVNPRA